MTVQELYNILEKEIDAGNIHLDSKVYLCYDSLYDSGVDCTKANDYIVHKGAIYITE